MIGTGNIIRISPIAYQYKFFTTPDSRMRCYRKAPSAHLTCLQGRRRASRPPSSSSQSRESLGCTVFRNHAQNKTAAAVQPVNFRGSSLSTPDTGSGREILTICHDTSVYIWHGDLTQLNSAGNGHYLTGNGQIPGCSFSLSVASSCYA